MRINKRFNILLCILVLFAAGLFIGAKISELTVLATGNVASGDLFVLTDIDDTTMAASGTTKSYSFASLLADILSTGGSPTGTWDYSGSTFVLPPVLDFSSATSVKIERYVTDNNGFTMTATQGYNTVVYATGAGTIVMPPVATGMFFRVEDHSGAAIVLNPDATGTEDTIRLTGAALAQGDSITSNSTAGDTVECRYYAADTWSCIFTQGPWTDSN